MLRGYFSVRNLAAAAAMLVLAVPGSAQDAPQKVAIEIQGKAEFDVIYHRALSNAAGAVLGSFIGAGIQSAAEASGDAEKRKALYPYVAGQAWRDFFIKTMTDSLAEKGLETVWVEPGNHHEPGTADMYIVLYPAKFGFRIVDSSTLMMASFIEFEAAYSTQAIFGKNRPVKEPFYLTDKSQVPYEQLLADTSGISPRIESVLKMAARRLTNKVVYNIQ